MILINEAYKLSNRLPMEQQENLQRLNHVSKHGHLVFLFSEGRTVGYAEVFRMKEPPAYPAIPWPVDDPQGLFAYVFAAVCEVGFVKDLLEIGAKTFNSCEWICYHRAKRNNKLNVERNKYYERRRR